VEAIGVENGEEDVNGIEKALQVAVCDVFKETAVVAKCIRRQDVVTEFCQVVKVEIFRVLRRTTWWQLASILNTD